MIQRGCNYDYTFALKLTHFKEEHRLYSVKSGITGGKRNPFMTYAKKRTPLIRSALHDSALVGGFAPANARPYRARITNELAAPGLSASAQILPPPCR